MDAGAAAQSRPWLALGQEIIEVLGKVDPEAFFRVVRAFDDCKRRWFFSGQGRSGLAASMMQRSRRNDVEYGAEAGSWPPSLCWGAVTA